MLEALLARRGTSEKFPRILHRICNDLFAIGRSIIFKGSTVIIIGIVWTNSIRFG